MPISLTGSLNLSGSLTTTGTITATTLVVQTITSSISSITGSTNFGSLAANTHTFTGSILITGSNYISVGTPSPIYTTTLMSAYGSGSDVDIDVKNNTSAGAANIYLRSQTDGSGEIRFSRNSDNSIQGRIQFSQVNGSMNFRTGGNDNKLFISSSNDVGISTATPKGRLDVYRAAGQSGTAAIVISNGEASPARNWSLNTEVVTSGDFAICVSTTTGGIPAPTGANTKFYITSAGTVGINNTIASTNYKLGVSGSAYINGSNGKGIFVTDGASYASIVGLNSAISAYNPLELRASGTDYQLYLTTGGNVGIATATAPEKLTVAGGISFSSYLLVGAAGYMGVGNQIQGGWTSTDLLILNNNSGGKIAINTTNGSAYNGLYLINGSTSWASISDERLKTDLVPIKDAVNKVSSLRSVIGRYKTDEVGITRSFLIAQDVQKVLPEAVNIQNNETKTLGLQYTDIIPLLVASIKELTARVQYLENK
jgi:hypothetical protein